MVRWPLVGNRISMVYPPGFELDRVKFVFRVVPFIVSIGQSAELFGSTAESGSLSKDPSKKRSTALPCLQAGSSHCFYLPMIQFHWC